MGLRAMAAIRASVGYRRSSSAGFDTRSCGSARSDSENWRDLSSPLTWPDFSGEGIAGKAGVFAGVIVELDIDEVDGKAGVFAPGYTMVMGERLSDR